MSIYVHCQERTQRYLMEAAFALLLEVGYEGLSISKIAERADVGRGTFYRYFEDVDAVFMAINAHYHLAMRHAVNDLMTQYESPEKERRAWQAIMGYLEELKPLLKALTSPKAFVLRERFELALLAGFEESLKQGNFLYPHWMQLPVDVMATFTAGAVSSVLKRWFAGELPYSAAELAEMLYKLLYHQA